MKRTALLIMPVVLGLALAPAAAEGPLSIGASMPMADAAMKNVDGKNINLKSVSQPAGTLVVFTCNHCPFAKKWESRIVELGNDYLTKGVGVVAINANDPSVNADDSYESMQRRAKDKGMEFPYVVDGTSAVAKAFGATRTPEAFLFDKSGKLVYHGAIDDNADDAGKVENAYLKTALDAVLKGAEVSVKETKSIGCTIKFRS